MPTLRALFGVLQMDGTHGHYQHVAIYADRRGHARITQDGPHAQLISKGRLTECTASGGQGCDFVFSDPPQKAWNDGANYHVMPQIGPVYCHTNRRE